MMQSLMLFEENRQGERLLKEYFEDALAREEALN